MCDLSNREKIEASKLPWRVLQPPNKPSESINAVNHSVNIFERERVFCKINHIKMIWPKPRLLCRTRLNLEQSCVLVVLVVVFVVQVSYAHVGLTFPPARKFDLDFLDNIRTKPPCGMPKGKPQIKVFKVFKILK